MPLDVVTLSLAKKYTDEHGSAAPSKFLQEAAVNGDTLTIKPFNLPAITYKPTGLGAEYIQLTGWDESKGWHDGGTPLTDEQAQILTRNELNYIWMNDMHRLDFRYRDNANNKATYSTSDRQKTHTIEINLTTKAWRYCHDYLQAELTAGEGIKIENDVISCTATGKVDDVKVNGVSVVTDKVANIDLTGKQDKLTAGDNITIDANNKISAVDTKPVWGAITGTLADQTDLKEALNAKASLEQLAAEETRASEKETEIETSLASEVLRATGREDQIEQDLIDRITDEAVRAEGIEEGLRTDLTTECTRAYNAEGQIDLKVTNEVTRATGAEATLQTNIGNEVTRAKAAEKVNADAIALETEQRTSQYSQLDTRITSEANTRATNDDVLQTNINTEKTRAEGVENEIIADLATEVENRTTKDTELEQRIENLEARGRFLSVWNCTTGLPETEPTAEVYDYKAGDYYIIGVVGTGVTLYQPSGTQYKHEASTVVETREVAVGDFYNFDGTKWIWTQNTQKTVTFKNIAGDAEDNINLKGKLDAIRTAIGAEQTRAEAKEAELATAVNTKVEKEITSTSGKSRMFNEADGGGAKFENANGNNSFVGVNDSSNGVAAQMYATKPDGTSWTGAILDASPEGMFYNVGNKSSTERMVAGREIAVKADVAEKSKVSVSATGTSTNVVKFITIDGTEYKLPEEGAKESEIFIAERGVTTYEAAKAAYLAGKKIVAKATEENNVVNYIPATLVILDAEKDNYQFIFTATTDLFDIYFEELVLDANGWGRVHKYNLEFSQNKVTEIKSTATDTQYPSAKAAYTAISGKSKVIVAASGTSTSEVQYITVDGTEYKLAGGQQVSEIYWAAGTETAKELIAQAKTKRVYYNKKNGDTDCDVFELSRYIDSDVNPRAIFTNVDITLSEDRDTYIDHFVVEGSTWGGVYTLQVTYVGGEGDDTHWTKLNVNGTTKKVSRVKASTTGSSTTEAKYITIDDTEYKLAGGTYVEGNVELTGEEDSLLSIKIGDKVYQNLNYHPFPESFVVNKTLKEFGQSVVNYAAFFTGCMWYGGLHCTDLPGGMMQCECKVTAIRDTHSWVENIAVVEIFSSEVAPFYWTYNTNSWEKGTGLNDWKYMAAIDGSKFDTAAGASDVYNVKVRKQSTWDGWEFYTEKETDILDGNNVGVIVPFAANTVPVGYLECNGAAVSRTTYSELFAVIGTTYGPGDGSTTFNLPNLQEKFVEGASTTKTVGTVLEAGLPNITGKVFQDTDAGEADKPPLGAFGYEGGNWENFENSGNHNSGYITFDASRVSPIYGKSDTVQPNAVVVKYVIKYTKTLGAVSEPDGTTIIYDENGKLKAVGGGGGQTYTAGNGLQLANNEFSIDEQVTATKSDLLNKQDKLTAGDNITISETNVISAAKQLPEYPSGEGATEKKYVLGLKYENDAWVLYWEIADDPTSSIVGIGKVDFMKVGEEK